MNKRVGDMIMTLAKVYLYLGLVVALILGIVAASEWWLFYGFGDFLLFGVGTAIVVFITALFTYGFGQLIENTRIISENTGIIKEKVNSCTKGFEESPVSFNEGMTSKDEHNIEAKVANIDIIEEEVKPQAEEKAIELEPTIEEITIQEECVEEPHSENEESVVKETVIAADEKELLEIIKTRCQWFEMWKKEKYPNGMTEDCYCDWEVCDDKTQEDIWNVNLFEIGLESAGYVYKCKGIWKDQQFGIIDEQDMH